MSRKKAVVAMSGGVDSSTALALLVEQGYECVGVSMQLWDYSKKEDGSGATPGSCCTLDDIHDARRVAESLGAPFYVVNVEEAFSKEVVDYFISSYTSGSTPNPCIKCNQILKFEVLLNKALGLEADYLATGHYARIERGPWGFSLKKGADQDKDQSYFLFTMTQRQLERVLFPVGSLTKAEVRERARKLGLKTSEKAESQEICFVEEPSYAQFLSERVASAPGDIIDTTGKVLGAHKGLFNYTIGQRKGLSLSGGPFYVLDIDVPSNKVVVGPMDMLYSKGLVAREVNWINPESKEKAGSGLTGVEAKIRYRHAGAKCAVTSRNDGSIEVIFEEPQKAVTPGQAVVIYRGDEVLCGGWIEGAIK
ncbi:MAG TPA: tRNA 2-thiouridine(34) synthase MnmA [Deltaproteobacteria bacterium]|nr:MAG: tRNA 2-thiouridine(34) synthase MnmA [Deltaproteobacteria bacterium GWA2_55_82]OIJ73664.1 MAG: tRNA 2-thiouridine(34) synthase MnmA [Deltaproteobacteria bacterium GWC2_55_46]HBG45947.1 tRNA 2-thiouridine(34) synthase MnmA [Deltaproteobacteria bacterium]HCY09633.1 tRNA 2-thiouridine(34) synthase MnmA [Deltaproteobacteria bacterium]